MSINCLQGQTPVKTAMQVIENVAMGYSALVLSAVSRENPPRVLLSVCIEQRGVCVCVCVCV